MEDAERLAEILTLSRGFLAPYEPFRAESYFTVAGQESAVQRLLESRSSGTTEPRVIVSDRGEVVGRITLNNIVRGPFESCSVGYWLHQPFTGQGLATRAVNEMVDIAFHGLGLHRVEAGTLLDNTASQAVLKRTGFVQFGLAPEYLRIAGEWRDHLLFQRIRPGA